MAKLRLFDQRAQLAAFQAELGGAGGERELRPIVGRQGEQRELGAAAGEPEPVRIVDR